MGLSTRTPAPTPIGDEAQLPWSETDDAIARLCEPYRCASSRNEQLQALDELECSLEQETNIAKREYVALHVLLEIPTGDAQLSDSVGRVLEACGSLASLSACVACLKKISEDKGTRKLTPTSGNQPFQIQSSQAPLRTCLSTLRDLLCTPDKNGRLIQGQAQARIIQPDWMEHFNLVGNTMLLLPQLIANACQSAQIHLPLWATSGHLLPRLVECGLQTQDPIYCQLLIQHFVRHRNSDNIVMGLGRYLDNSSMEKVATEQDHSHDKLVFLANVLVQASNRLTPREVAIFIRSLLRHELSKEITMNTSSVESMGLSAILDLCQAMLQVSRDSQDAFLRLMAFQSSSVMADQSMDARLCRIVLQLLSNSQHESTDSDDEDQDDEGPTYSPLHQHLQSMVDTWSQSIHVQQTDRRIQRHITTMLLYGLELMPSSAPQDEVHSMLTVGVLQGVTVRLESAITEVRIDGMRVAQTLAQRLGQDLEFDELKQEQAKVIDRTTSSGEALDESSPQLSEKNEVLLKRTRIRRSKQKTKDKTEPQIMDPDADYVSDEEENDESSYDHEIEDVTAEVEDDDSIWDHEEDLVPYDLDDDEQDLRETPRPLHLMECLELLRTPETHDAAYSRHESALHELPALIKLRPDDLPDICVPLAVQLLRMENKFNLVGFAEMRSDSLCALVVQEPLSVGQRLIHELFEDGGLSDRMNILLALQEAADELSGNKILEEQRIGRFNRLEQQDSSDHDISIAKTVFTHLEKLESQTRRKRSAHPQPLTISNKFASIAPSWFYSLVGNFVQRKGDTAMWSGSTGSRLLAHFFFALTTIVESSGTTSPGTAVLAKDLFELVWSFRTVEVADVRKCVLVAVATTMALVPEDQIVAMLTGGDLSQVLAEISQKDPDRDCRKLASSISLSVLQTMDSLHDRRIDFGGRR